MIRKTTIQVATSTKIRLQRLGKKGDSYDDIIRGLLDEMEVKK